MLGHSVPAALVPASHIPFLSSQQPVPQCLICHTATWLVLAPAIIGSVTEVASVGRRGGGEEEDTHT